MSDFEKPVTRIMAAARPGGKSYPLEVKLAAVRLVLADGLTHKAAAARLQITQPCVSRWLVKFRSGRLAEEALACHLPTVPLSQLAEQLRALQLVQAAWRQVFGPRDP